MLERFAVAHLSLPIPAVAATFTQMAEAVTQTRALIPAYIADHPEFQAIGRRLMAFCNVVFTCTVHNATFRLIIMY